MRNFDELMQPSLSGVEGPATSIYSMQTGYLAAFFGGPLGGATIALLNAHRLKRLGSDWPLGLAALGVTFGLLWWQLRSGGEAWLIGHLGHGGPGLAIRIVGLAFYGIVYAVHRQYYRNMALLGLEAPSGWIPGIAAIVGGAVVMLVLGYVLSS